VDEVLAVGDAEFQRKCIGKIEGIATGEGRTVLFVSHDLSAIVGLCTSAMCLIKGEIVHFGGPAAVCAAYAATPATAPRSRNSSTMPVEITLLDGSDQPCPNLTQSARLKFRVVATAPEGARKISLIVRDARGSVLFQLFDPRFSLSKACRANLAFDIDAGRLPGPGIYTVDLWFGDRMAYHIDRIDGAIEFEVIAAADTGAGPPFAGRFSYTGSFYYPSRWTWVSGLSG